MTDQLLLQNQLCFPLYAASRLITRAYQPFLDELELTYPQYLVLLVLWETDDINVNTLTEKLLLKTNTMTPLLQRMEKQGLIVRKKAALDKREVNICLTPKAQDIKTKAATIPEKMINALNFENTENIDFETMVQIKKWINTFINSNKHI